MIRIGIVGAGAIAAVHIDGFLQFGAMCEVAAVCDTYVEKAQSLITEKNLNAKAYADIQTMLTEGALDAISICLPPNLHASVAIQALAGKKHVIVEKPMAGSLEECDHMIAAAKENNRLLCVVSQNRWKTQLANVKRIMDEGLLGKVVHASFDSLWWRGGVYYDLWWRGTWEQEAGGVFTSHSVHYLDLMQMLFGMPKRVQAFIGNVNHTNSECEDIGFAVFTYEDKVINFTSSLVSHGEKQAIVINGEKASVTIPFSVSAYNSLPNGFPEPNKELEQQIHRRYEELGNLALEGHPAQLLNFLLAIEGKEALALDGNTGRQTIELIHAVYKSAVQQRPVDLPLEPSDPFYTKEGLVQSMPRFHTKGRSVENFSTSKISLGRDFNA
ncbi:MAG: Gfo/Idh/MocA family oxidoreductase [Sphaerochaeta sp.]|jgi:predicted dehydrogenase|uniref:Gfo/Idh/MocA family protein n=1 Tax=Sphaerochaeta sp. TaxID=1972642 RepID=UPI0025838165|nr:Gfo/Idh/MocA family oxidoreductase [Sphaerochaeta sp.]MDD4039214.1 Gfo/Idh/MocA family oxidoreductase [Sphaerochaeta sp.]MDX9985421.1 Gfo/Idh/MocA family oxidoreductase [Sphaerochaeta sp.]